jgi:hypothetical protein
MVPGDRIAPRVHSRLASHWLRKPFLLKFQKSAVNRLARHTRSAGAGPSASGNVPLIDSKSHGYLELDSFASTAGGPHCATNLPNHLRHSPVGVGSGTQAEPGLGMGLGI